MSIAGRIAGAALPIVIAWGAAAQGSGRLQLVQFDSPKDLVGALTEIMRAKHGETTAKKWEGRLTGVQACAVPEPSGRIVIYTLGNLDTNSGPIRAINIAHSLHGIGGTWGAKKTDPQHEVFSCVIINPFTARGDIGHLGSYSPTDQASRIKDTSQIFGDADSAYHENEHHIF